MVVRRNSDEARKCLRAEGERVKRVLGERDGKTRVLANQLVKYVRMCRTREDGVQGVRRNVSENNSEVRGCQMKGTSDAGGRRDIEVKPNDWFKAVAIQGETSNNNYVGQRTK